MLIGEHRGAQTERDNDSRHHNKLRCASAAVNASNDRDGIWYLHNVKLVANCGRCSPGAVFKLHEMSSSS